MLVSAEPPWHSLFFFHRNIAKDIIQAREVFGMVLALVAVIAVLAVLS
jgi:hypothetical protein